MNTEDLLNWVENIENEKHKVLFLYGTVGNGKFVHTKNLLNEKYNINSFTYIDFLFEKDISNTIKNINNYNNVFFMMTKQKKPIIIIKEVEFIKTNIIKKILSELNIKKIKKNKNKINIPIILIGSGKCIKTLKDLHDICKIVKYENDIIDVKQQKFDNILKKNNLELNTNIKKYILDNYNNYNKMNIIIKFIKNYKKSINEIFTLLIKNINYNTELYENVKHILTNTIEIKDIFNYYYLDKILLQLLIHENYKKYIMKNLKNKEDIHKCITLVSNNIMNSDIINEYLYVNHLWNIQDLCAILNCQYTSYIMNNMFVTNEKKQLLKLNYTRILTKNSLLFIKFKHYKLILHTIKYKHNFDKDIIEFINKNLIIYLLNDPKYGYEQLIKYGYTNKDILKIIKFSNEYYYINDNLKYKKDIVLKIRKM